MHLRTALILFLLLPTSALAEARGFEITPFVGYRFGGEILILDRDNYPSFVDVEENVNFGLTFDIPVVAGLKIEVLLDHQSTELASQEPIFGQPRQLGDIDISYYQAGVLYQWLRGGPAQPFVVHTIGVAHLAPEYGVSEDKFSASLGGGVKLFPTDNFGIRFEGRGFWVNTSDSNYWDDGHCCGYGYNSNTDLTQFELNLGFIFAW